MVKLRRLVEDQGVTAVPSYFPQKPLFYYGIESELKEYNFYFTIYDKERTPNSIIENGIRPDFILKTKSKYSLEQDLQNSGFLKDKDFGVLNKNRNSEMNTLLGFILDPLYSSSSREWDYAEVYLDVNNNISLKWRH